MFQFSRQFSVSVLTNFSSFANFVVSNFRFVAVELSDKVAHIFSHPPIQGKNRRRNSLVFRSENQTFEHRHIDLNSEHFQFKIINIFNEHSHLTKHLILFHYCIFVTLLHNSKANLLSTVGFSCLWSPIISSFLTDEVRQAKSNGSRTSEASSTKMANGFVALFKSKCVKSNFYSTCIYIFHDQLAVMYQ